MFAAFFAYRQNFQIKIFVDFQEYIMYNMRMNTWPLRYCSENSVKNEVHFIDLKENTKTLSLINLIYSFLQNLLMRSLL